MSTFYLTTLGCKVNQYESQAIAEALQKQGFARVMKPAAAQYIYINSCAVTARAVRDLRKMLRRMSNESCGARIIVTGCAAQIMQQELETLEEVDLVIPQSRKKLLLNHPFPDSDLENKSVPEDFRITGYLRARPAVKVQDGCSQACSYCIVPSTRGGPVSRDPGDVLFQIRELLNRGFPEIVICGINLGLYGRDLNPCCDFWDLLNFLEQNLAREWNNRARIRLSSLDPGQLNSKALDTIANSRMLCPHFHLAMQSGSPGILRAMRRDHYSFSNVDNFINQVKKTIPLFSLGTDILVGFPGETGQDFDQTRRMVHNLPLSYAHVFTFSPRPGTPAAGYSPQVTEQDKKHRSMLIKKIIQEKKSIFVQELLARKELRLVMEDRYKGMCEYYVECFSAQCPSGLKAGDAVRAKPLRAEGTKLRVEVNVQCWY